MNFILGPGGLTHALSSPQCPKTGEGMGCRALAMNHRSYPRPPCAPSPSLGGWRWRRNWYKDKRNPVESKPWLMPVLLKERTCRELWRAGGKPVPSSRPRRLPLGMGALTTQALSLCKTDCRCSGAAFMGQSSHTQDGSLLCPDSKLAECCGVYSNGLCFARYLTMSPACRKVNSPPDIRQLWWARLEDSRARDQ